MPEFYFEKHIQVYTTGSTAREAWETIKGDLGLSGIYDLAIEITPDTPRCEICDTPLPRAHILCTECRADKADD